MPSLEELKAKFDEVKNFIDDNHCGHFLLQINDPSITANEVMILMEFLMLTLPTSDEINELIEILTAVQYISDVEIESQKNEHLNKVNHASRQYINGHSCQNTRFLFYKLNVYLNTSSHLRDHIDMTQCIDFQSIQENLVSFLRHNSERTDLSGDKNNYIIIDDACLPKEIPNKFPLVPYTSKSAVKKRIIEETVNMMQSVGFSAKFDNHVIIGNGQLPLDDIEKRTAKRQFCY